MWRDLVVWTDRNEEALSVLALASGALLVLSVALLPLMIARMPQDYFARPEGAPHRRARPPWLRAARTVARNVVGAVLLVAGLAMLVLPGQGILTILVALMLLNYPHKRRFEVGLARRPRVLRGLNWLRRRAGRPPFLAPPPV